MPTVVYVDLTGVNRAVVAPAGATVMDTAVRNGVAGIVGQCGGSLACASCHVYVEDPWLQLTGRAEGMEDEMLDDALADRLPGSRLSCQIRLTDTLDGLTVRVAPEQL
jgi:2Fe-2S ferredoxin